MPYLIVFTNDEGKVWDHPVLYVKEAASFPEAVEQAHRMLPSVFEYANELGYTNVTALI